MGYCPFCDRQVAEVVESYEFWINRGSGGVISKIRADVVRLPDGQFLAYRPKELPRLDPELGSTLEHSTVGDTPEAAVKKLQLLLNPCLKTEDL